MQTYPTDSPQAAARLLAVVLVADGNYSLDELRALDRLEAPRRLGLTSEEMKAVIDQFCEDLLIAAQGHWTGSSQMDDATRRALLNEVQDPALRAQVMALCQGLAMADGHLADDEANQLDAMEKAWRTAPRAA